MMNHLQTCCSMPLQFIPISGGKNFSRFYWIEKIQSIVGLACVSNDTRISWNIHVMHRKNSTGTRARKTKQLHQIHKINLEIQNCAYQMRYFSFIVKCVTIKVIVSDGFEWYSFKYVPQPLGMSRNDTDISCDIHLHSDACKSNTNTREIKIKTKTTYTPQNMWERWTIYV